jgi:hypothetical protein
MDGRRASRLRHAWLDGAGGSAVEPSLLSHFLSNRKLCTFPVLLHAVLLANL